MTAGLAILAYGAIAASLLCFVRAVVDFRARRFVWGGLSLVVASVLLWGLMTPIQTHAVKIDLPAAR